MLSPKYKNKTLFVLAVPEALVREIDEKGLPLRTFRHVGRDAQGDILSEGQVLPYHAHYIKLLKEGSLFAADLATAELAGTNFSQ